MAPAQKKAADNGWSIVLMDESGFMLQPVVRRTWAPKGHTPIQYTWDRHDRLSTIAAISVAPQRLRFGLHFAIQGHNVRFDDVMAFLAMLHRRLRRKFILILDRYSAHRQAVRLLLENHPHWLEVAWLPAYAPDLNPVELVWNRTKYADLANFIPDDIRDLHDAVANSLTSTRAATCLLRGFFRHAGLKL
jgi:transposase